MTLIKTIDNQTFELTKEQIPHINLIKSIKKYSKVEEPLDILVSSNDIQNIIKYLQKNPKILYDSPLDCELVFEQSLLKFLKRLTPEELVSLTNAANYLEIYYLLEACSFVLSELFKDKNLKELKSLFNISQLDPDNKKKVEDEFGWMSFDKE